MLLLQSQILQLPVASIQASHRIATIEQFVIQPRGLKIAALLVAAKNTAEPRYLHIEDILEARREGVLIDHNEQLMDSEDLVRLQQLLDIHYEVLHKKVVTENNKKIGSVVDFIINTVTWEIQKIHVQPSVVKMLSTSDRIIDRSQIIRVTDKKIIVKEPTIPSRSRTEAIRKQMRLQQMKPSTAKIQADPEQT